MKIEYRFTFRGNRIEITEFFDNLKIKYSNDYGVGVLEILEDHEKFEEVKSFLASHDINYCRATSKTIYTKQEIEEAEWLTARSIWMNYFPQPQDDYMHTTYTPLADYCDKCWKGSVQKASFVLKNKPNWGSKHFLMINWVWDELFVTDKVESVFKENDVKGIDFYKVLSRSGKEYEGTKQIYIENYLKPGLKKESIREELICKKCQFKKYITNLGFLYYDKEVFKNLDVDMIKSHEKFGELGCTSLIFISQRLYRIITENKLGKNLLVEPVQLV